jgi:(1->4)-alpha-D-glucan 1-alpha-D-glucosylmutase
MAAPLQPPTPLAVTLQVIEEVRQRQVHPVATYRLQLHKDFTLHDAAAIVPYLCDLGISHVYCSPFLRAKAGSTHGYDLCDYMQINPELGGEAAYREFTAKLAEHGLGHILDMVPNHMAASTQNPWWNDVLENGPNSPYAHFFDIDWQPIKPELHDKLLLPILGQQYGAVLEEHQLTIEFQHGAFFVRYFDSELPLGPKSIIPILQHRLGELEAALGAEHPELIELESVITALEHLPSQTARDLASIRERQREKEVIKRRLRELAAASEPVRLHIDRNMADYGAAASGPQSVDALDGLLHAQAYRLCHWRAAFDEINYRRFFDINELAAISMEIPEVFWRSHPLVRSLLADGSLSGLRIDHIDGLFDPQGYLLRLQWAYLADLGQRAFQRLWVEAATAETSGDGVTSGAGVAVGERSSTTANPNEAPPSEPAQWSRIAAEVLRLSCEQVGLPPPGAEDLRAVFGPETVGDALAAEPAATTPAASPLGGQQPLYVLTEKILGPDEPLPETWPVAGTTGYDFVTTLNGLFVAPQGWDDIVRAYQRFTGDDAPYEQVVQESKRLILRVAMSSELLMLAHRLNRVSEQHRRSRDLTLNMLRLAAREVLVSFPVYRVYPGKEGVSERDRRFVDLAVAKAKRQNPAFDPSVFDFVRNVLLLQHPEGLTSAALAEREVLAGKFQQVTSPVMAKGVEDTAFYVWVPLGSVNEVGGDPRRPITTPKQFHDHNRDRRAKYPQAMLATTTHDTKRTEDVRARLNVLSEIPRDWRNAVQRFARLNKRWRREVDGEPAPTPRDEYLYYQSLLGIWPMQSPTADERAVLIQRLQGYMEKATHEAKQRTSWINPNRPYDEAVREFVAQTLRDSPQNRFVAEVQTFHERIVDAGQYNALAQLVLKLLSPGVPDIYQGQELWDYSLVDPDNRRPVDYDLRREALAPYKPEAQARGEGGPPHFSLRDPKLKLLVTHRLLQIRRRMPHLWSQGDYVPFDVVGPLGEHLVAFGWRGAESQRIELLAVVPRFVQKLIDAERARGADIPVGQDLLPSSIWHGTAIAWPMIGELTGTNLFTGQQHSLGGSEIPANLLLADFPLAVVETRELAIQAQSASEEPAEAAIH